MSLFQRLTRTLRPTAFHPATPLRRHPHPHLLHTTSKTIPSDFYTPSLRRIGLGQRFYQSASFSAYGTAQINTNVIYGLIAANSAIFLYAQYAKAQATQGFPGPFLRFLQNFTLNYDGVLKEGRWWTMITSVFAHISPMHLLGNMLSIYYLGNMVAQTPGVTPIRLLALVFGSGLTGSAGYLYIRHKSIEEGKALKYAGPREGYRDRSRGLGFSGSVMGVGTVAAFLYPRAKMAIYGIIPVPLWMLMTGYAVFDGFYLNDSNSRIGHAGHIGGLAFGVVYYFAKMRGLPIGR